MRSLGAQPMAAQKRNGPGSLEPGPSLFSPSKAIWLPKRIALATRGLDQLADGVHALVDRLQRLLGEALDACRDINNRAAAAQIHNTLGETHREAGALASALACHREAFAIADRLGVRLQFARALEGLGDVHAALEGLESGRRYWAQADRAYAAMGVPVAQRIG